MENLPKLEFVSLSSMVSPSFWQKLTELKLNVDKLEETERFIWGYFANLNTQGNLSVLEVDSTSFNVTFDNQRIYIPFHGKLLNKNTIESFKGCNKMELIQAIGKEIWDDIESGKALKSPSLLNKFFILTFADLKKYHYYYWFGFPVPNYLYLRLGKILSISEIFDEADISELFASYCELGIYQKPYFLVHRENKIINVCTLESRINSVTINNCKDYYFVFFDTSMYDEYPGTILRNYVTFILHYCPFLGSKELNFISFRLSREQQGKITCEKSLIFQVHTPEIQTSIYDLIFKDPNSVWVGWEKNERGNFGPRLANMKSNLDPQQLAEDSADLNLKLMKWRILSGIDLDKIKKTTCLLLGAGTLGCSVARALMAWGVRNITFVDNANVSFSNPVRQNLYTFDDAVKGLKKVDAASINIQKVFPGVKAKGFNISIPMPGHTIGESVLIETREHVDKLTELIKAHDIIFLLMDSRESRWLPTLLGRFFKKIVINAALGFDTYLVMRHGIRDGDDSPIKYRQHPEGFKSIKGSELGCYFCNDVTAPGDSMANRTLDQQCTVTRPGVSAIASALAVELAVSLIQHKEGGKAPAFYKTGSIQSLDDVSNQSVLGLLPHSIRGFLTSYSQVLPACQRFEQCTACSDIVLYEYGRRGFEFLLQVFNASKYLEILTGLTQLCKDLEEIEVWEISDDETEDYEGSSEK